MIEFITNKKQTHKKSITELFSEAEEVFIAVAFLKNSGLNNIQEYLKRFNRTKTLKITFFVGLGFGTTSPKALKKINKLISKNSNNKLILCTPAAGIFHPKIYLFRKGKEVTIIVGSSNLTEAGWLINDEASIKINTKIASQEYKDIIEYFEGLEKEYKTDDIENLINEYEKVLEEYEEDYYVPKFHFKRDKTVIDGIDIPRLKHYYKKYLQSNDFIEPINREEKYKQARKNLDIIASKSKLNKKQFHDLFGPLVGHAGYEKLWHSGSIHRKTHKTLEYIPAFRKLVRVIEKNINKPSDIAYDNITQYLNKKRKAKEISGIGQNIIAEIMLSYNYNKFANINDNPITVLSLLGKNFKSISSFKGKDYKEYLELLGLIKEELKLNSFLEIDSFFNYVYWNIDEE